MLDLNWLEQILCGGLLLFVGGALCPLFFLRVTYPAIMAAGYRKAERAAQKQNGFDHEDFMNEEKKVGVQIGHNRVMDAFRVDQRIQNQLDREAAETNDRLDAH